VADQEDAADSAEHDDDVQRKMREALDRKKAGHRESHPGGVRNQGVGESRNDKAVRQFRRKAGS